jgi:PAS domain S-box-containing protein
MNPLDEPVNVLLVDDRVDNLNALEAILEPTGARLVRAQSADEALMALVRDEFAAIVLDIRMPGMDGLELARLVKQRERTRHIPILFLTAHMLDEREALLGYDVGAVDYLSKPIKPEILRSKIGVFIELFANARALAVESAERRRVAAELREANDALEARVEERTAEAVLASRLARESEERLHQALAAARAGVWEYDFARDEGRWSPEMFDLHGWERSSRAPSFEQFRQHLHPDDRQPASRAMSSAIEKGGPFELEFRFVRPDGEAIWISSSGIVELGPDGQAVASRGVNQDITARRSAEQAMRESEKRLRIANEVAGMGTYIADLENDRLRYGPSLCQMLGVPAGTETRLEDGFRFIHPEDLPRLRAALEAALDPASEGRARLELRVLRSDGEIRWCSYSSQLEFRETPTGRVPIYQFGATFDITDRKQAEVSLKEADRRKDEFLTTLAHELRSPLAPLRYGLEILRMAGNDREATEQVHAMLERQVEHMVRLVDDLLEVSRITRGKIELRMERVELGEIVRSAIETVRPLIDSARLDLEVSLPSEPLELDADPVRLVQVFANILNNAAKFTDEGGKVWLTTSRQAGEVVIAIRDTGLGISAEMLPRIFEAFAQADHGRSQSQGGLGVGLHLARVLVELHGGRIEASSAGPGTGSEFRVRLPFSSERPARRQETPGCDAGEFAPIGLRALVVDDSRDTADSLALMLRALGSEVEVAYSGATALDAIARRRPDVVLLDIGMPGMSGHEVASCIRAQPELRGLTLIAVTGWGQAVDRQRSKEAGFDHHLVKPVGLDSLQGLLASLAPAAP